MDKIREHILNQAREEADAIVRAAKEEAGRHVAAAQERIARDLEGRLAHMKAELEREHQRAVDRLNFDHRLETLRRKREIIDEVFNQAKARFVETAGYREWLERRLASVADLSGEVICNQRDRAVCRTTLQRMAEGGRIALTLAERDDDPRDHFAGGIIVRTGQFDLDLSLESALNDVRGRVMPELIAQAFSGLEESAGGGE